MDACGVIPGFGVTAAIFDDQVHGFEARIVTVVFRRIGCGGEEAAADAAGVGNGLELGRYTAQIMADVVQRVDFPPLF